MKCADPACNRQAIRNRNYCSDFCAQAGSIRSPQLARSEPTVASTIAEDGDPSAASCVPEREIESDTENELATRKPEENAPTRSEKSTMPITKESANSAANDISEKPTASVSTDTESFGDSQSNDLPTRRESAPVLPHFAEGNSVSKSLIGDSVRQLHGLMTDVGVSIRSSGDRINPQLVSAACNCAKQIGQLLKLQLEWEKTQKAGGARRE